jgi:hypothetical protein
MRTASSRANKMAPLTSLLVMDVAERSSNRTVESQRDLVIVIVFIITHDMMASPGFLAVISYEQVCKMKFLYRQYRYLFLL